MIQEHQFSYNPLLYLLPPLAKKNTEAALLLKEKGLESYDFTLGDPKEPTPDFIVQALRDGISNVSQYPSTIGNPELRTAGANWIKRRFDVTVNPHTQLISSNGSKEAIFHIPQVLINPTTFKNTIVFPEPAYPIYRSGTLLAGGQPFALPLNPDKNYIFDVNDIPDNQLEHVAALWLCYPHNPTGATMPNHEAQKIYEWALKHNIIILADECYVDSYFEGETPPLSFLQISEQNNFKNVLCFFSLSKRSGMTGYRSGLIVGDETLINLYTKYRFNIGVGTPDCMQNAAIAAWSDDEHIKSRNNVFFQKRKCAEAFFNKNNIEFLKSQTTFYMWIKVPQSYKDSAEYCEYLQNYGIFLTPGIVFGKDFNQYVRLALVPNLEELHKAFELWQKSINTKSI